MSRSTIQKIVASLALVIAGSAALAFGVAHLRSELPGEAKSVAAAPVTASRLPNFEAKSQGSQFATAPARIYIVTAADTREASSGAKTPIFDVARIDPTGDAVIAGSAAPGASVELLRDGEVQDRVVADRSGQFVMTPSRLPAGDYALTLRSTQTDGKQATSEQSVAVALQPRPKEQTTVALLTPGKAADDANLSYRSLPPLTLAPDTGVAPHRGNRRHIGHRFYAFHEQRHHVVFGAHHAAFTRVAQTPPTPRACGETNETMALFLCLLGFH